MTKKPMVHIAALAMAGALLAGPAFACGGAPVCTVKDPTGTPLNIRLSPAGKVLGTARNGTKLEFIDHQIIGRQKWARVARYDPVNAALEMDGGYAFAPYLRCERSLSQASPDVPVVCVVADPTRTPLNIRTQPNGEIVGTVRNGTRLRVSATRTVNGKQWAMVGREPADNAIGWVFDSYMKCEEDSH